MRLEDIDLRIVHVTPEIAKEMLKNNEGNRSLKIKHIEALTTTMEMGKWRPEQPDNILVLENETGRLLDGQNRLNALIKANMSFDFQVRYVNAGQNYTFNTCVPRSVADNVRINGKQWKNVNWHCSTITFLKTMFMVTSERSSLKLSQDELSFYVGKYYEDLQVVSSCVWNGSKPLTRTSDYASALFVAHMSGVDKASLLKFTKAVNTGMNYEYNDNTALAIRNYILDIKGSSQSSTRTNFKVYQKGIYDYVNGVTRKRKYIAKDGINVYADSANEKYHFFDEAHA